MSLSMLALLLGVFAVPAVALALGHRVAKRPARQRAAFWGVVIGHTVAMLAAAVAAMYLPVKWSEGDVARGAVGLWGMLVLGVLGGGIGYLLGGQEREAPPSPRPRAE